MGKFKKILSLLVCTGFILALLAGPALAKGGRGFSSGGRTSFSTGAKGYSTGGGLLSGKSTGSFTGTKSGGGSLTKVDSSPGTPQSTVGGGASSYGQGFGTGTGSFSTTRQGNPPTLYGDYSTGKQDYSTGTKSYSTGVGSYSGSWNRETFAASGMDKYPSKPPVGIFGSPPKPPYYYHNRYWDLPLLARLFFQPNYYWLPWGYHFFAPRLLTWIVAVILIGAVIIVIRNRLRGSPGH